MRYTARGEHNRDFELFNDNNTSLGRVHYSGWFSIKVDITIGNNTYKIEPSNIWHTDLHVKTGDETIAEIKFNWIGNMVVKMSNGRTYLFKAAFWHNKFTVVTEDERSVAILRPEFVWAKLKFNYEIETEDDVDGSNNPLLLLIFIYCCNQTYNRSFGGIA